MRFIYMMALAFSLASPAFASFNGRWAGNGDINFAPGNNLGCGAVHMEFNQSFQYFDILRAQAFCSNATYNFPVGRLTIENGVLKDNGFAMGRIGPDFFYVMWSYRPGNLNILDMRLQGRGFMSMSHTDAQNGRMSTEIRATLAPN